MPEPTSCAGCCVRTGTYCDRCDLLVGLPGLHVIKVVDGADLFDRDGGVAASASGLPSVWGDRHQRWPAHGGVGRCAVFWSAGWGVVAETDLAVPRSCLFRQILHRARRADLPAAGLVDDPSVLVGDRTAAGRACLGARSGSAARDDMADSVAQHPAAAGATG